MLLINFDDFPTDLPVPSPQRIFSDYTPLFELKIKSVPFIPSVLFNTIREQTKLLLTPMKAFSYKIIYTDGTNDKHLCKTEKLYEQLRKHFDAKNYDYNRLVIIDEKNLFVDFMNENSIKTSRPYLSEEYRVIEKNLLISIILEFQEKEWKYLGIGETRISSIINRFLLDQMMISNQIVLGFFDELGKSLEEDNSINKIYHSNSTDSIRIKIIQYENETSQLGEITLCSKEGKKNKLFQY
jgi:hypothetical protein